MIKIRSIKIVDLMDVVEAAGEDAWAGNPIWNEMIDHGQDFGPAFVNDSIFKYTLPSINGEKLSPVQQRIKSICWAAMEDEDTIYFNVCW